MKNLVSRSTLYHPKASPARTQSLGGRCLSGLAYWGLWTLLLLALLPLTSTPGLAQPGQRGHTMLRYFSPLQYKSSDQNWAVVQDALGRMFFGSTDHGVLVYDGVRFHTIPLASSQFVRYMALGASGLVYVGSIGDFGRLVPNQVGELHYESLLPTVQDSVPEFQDVYKVYAIGQKIFFCTVREFFVYDEVTGTTSYVHIPSDHSFLAFSLGQELVIGYDDTELIFYKDGQFSRDTIIPSARFSDPLLQSKQLYAVLPLKDNRLLLAYGPGGLFYYDRATHRIEDLPSHLAPTVDSLIRMDATIYSMHRLRNGNIGLGFIFSEDVGYVEITPEGQEVEVLSVGHGLGNSFVTEFAESSDGTLWLTHNVGITAAETCSPFHRFTEQDGINDVVLCMHEDRGAIYFGTMAGLQYLRQTPHGPTIASVQGISVPVWDYLSYSDPYSGEQFGIAQAMTDVYEVRNGKATSISVWKKDPNRMGRLVEVNRGSYKGYSLFVPPTSPDLLFMGLQNSIAVLQRRPNGTWLDMHPTIVPAVNDEIRGIDIDDQGTIWLTTLTTGLYRLRKVGLDILRSKHITEKNGLPTLRQNEVCVLDGKAYITTPTGIFAYDATRDTLVAVESALIPGLGVSNLTGLGNKVAMQRFTPREDTLYVEAYNNFFDTTTTPDDNLFRRLPARWIDALTFTHDSTLWAAFSKEIYSYRPVTSQALPPVAQASIAGVVALRNDSTLFAGTYFTCVDGTLQRIITTQPDSMQLEIPHGMNSLLFRFGASSFAGDGVEFQCLLESNDNAWSSWERTGEVRYTNLFEGNYTLKVRMRDAYQRLSRVTTYRFTILPPFYRTWWAYLIYVCLAAFVLYMAARWNNRRLIKEKERLAKLVAQRTAEVVAQKDEIEQQRDKIEHQKAEIEASIKYASEIQHAILPRKETMDSIFPEHFVLFLPRDVVSGDFYWMNQIGNKKICCIADCTGHGVPGGFMSMLSASLLYQVTRDMANALDTAEVLNRVRALIISSLHQTADAGSNKDGMDLVLFILDADTNTLQFSGANNPLIIVRNGQVQLYKPDHMPVGVYVPSKMLPFTSQVIQLEPGDMIYAFSDGFEDQFGGPKNRKFMQKNLTALLLSISQLPVEEQLQRLQKEFFAWLGSSMRMDDVEVFGARVVDWNAAASKEEFSPQPQEGAQEVSKQPEADK